MRLLLWGQWKWKSSRLCADRQRHGCARNTTAGSYSSATALGTGSGTKGCAASGLGIMAGSERVRNVPMELKIRR